MSLPSFSGKTTLQPQLLKYSCDLRCRIRVVPPAAVVTTTGSTHLESEFIKEPGVRTATENNAGVQAVLMSKPIFAMHFDDMFMGVEAPTVVAPSKGSSSLDVTPAGVLQPAFASRK